MDEYHTTGGGMRGSKSTPITQRGRRYGVCESNVPRRLSWVGRAVLLDLELPVTGCAVITVVAKKYLTPTTWGCHMSGYSKVFAATLQEGCDKKYDNFMCVRGVMRQICGHRCCYHPDGRQRCNSNGRQQGDAVAPSK